MGNSLQSLSLSGICHVPVMCVRTLAHVYTIKSLFFWPLFYRGKLPAKHMDFSEVAPSRRCASSWRWTPGGGVPTHPHTPHHALTQNPTFSRGTPRIWPHPHGEVRGDMSHVSVCSHSCPCLYYKTLFFLAIFDSWYLFIWRDDCFFSDLTCVYPLLPSIIL